ncbi:hypothetical protein EON65_17280, partial [archaeon]
MSSFQIDDEEWDDFATSPLPDKRNDAGDAEGQNAVALDFDLDQFLDSQAAQSNPAIISEDRPSNEPDLMETDDRWDDFTGPVGSEVAVISLAEPSVPASSEADLELFDFIGPSSSVSVLPDQPTIAPLNEPTQTEELEVSTASVLPDITLPMTSDPFADIAVMSTEHMDSLDSQPNSQPKHDDTVFQATAEQTSEQVTCPQFSESILTATSILEETGFVTQTAYGEGEGG